jgi:hypothetical protein
MRPDEPAKMPIETETQRHAQNEQTQEPGSKPERAVP